MASLFGCTLKELGQRLSYHEYLLWQKFYEHDPWGGQRIDLHFAQLTAAVLAPHMKGTPKPEKFLLFADDRHEPLHKRLRARLARLTRKEGD